MVGDHKNDGLSVSQNMDHEAIWMKATQEGRDVFKNDMTIPLKNMDIKSFLSSHFNKYGESLGYFPEDQKEFECEFWKRMYFPKKENQVVIGNGYYIKLSEDGGRCYLYKEGEKDSLGGFYEKEYEIIPKEGGEVLVYFGDDKMVVLNPSIGRRDFRSAIEYKNLAGSPYIAIRDVWRNTFFLDTEKMHSSPARSIARFNLTENGETILLKRRWWHFLKPYVLLARDGRFSKPFSSYDGQVVDPFFTLYNKRGKAIGTFYARI